MTPMPPEVPRTLAAHRMIIGKVQVVLAHRKMPLGALEALSLALLPPERIVIKEAKRLALILGSAPYQTVERLHKHGLVACSGGDKSRYGRMTVELTPKGIELAEAIRKALGGEEMVRMEAAE